MELEIMVLGTGSMGNCYVVHDDNHTLVLDAGLNASTMSYRAWKEGYNHLPLEAIILVTHEHQDHSQGLRELMLRGNRVIMSKGTKEALGYDYEENIIIAEDNKPLYIDDMYIKPIAVEHDAAEPLNFIIEFNENKIGYFTDLIYVPEVHNNFTHLLIETNYDKETMENSFYEVELVERVKKAHMSVETATEYLKSIKQDKLKKVIGIHKSYHNLNVERAKRMLDEALEDHVDWYIADTSHLL